MDTKKYKMIIVNTAGIQHLLGGVAGPILTPFPCRISTILQLIITGKSVYEVLKDGTKVRLTRSNYNKDNSLENKNPTVFYTNVKGESKSKNKTESKKEVPVAEVANETVVEEKVNETVVETTEEVSENTDVKEENTNQQQQKYNKKKNK